MERNYWLSKYTRIELLQRRYYYGIAARNYHGGVHYGLCVVAINEALREWDVIHNG